MSITINAVNILLYLMEIRQEYFIENILQFYKKKIKNLNNISEFQINKIIETDLIDIFPRIMLTNNENIINYSNFYDFDLIFGNSFFPLLISIFINCENFDLICLVLKLIFKCFRQRKNIIASLKRVHLLIDEKEIQIYNQIKNKIDQLKLIFEQSEIWLCYPDFINNPNYKYKFVLYKVINFIEDINSYYFIFKFFLIIFINVELLYENDNEKIIIYERQCLMKNLNLISILIKFLRDGSKVLEKIKEENVKTNVFIKLFKLIYKLLIILSESNPINQNW